MKDLKKNRVFSFAIICLTYLLAILFGCLISNLMTSELWVNILVGNLVATLIVFISSLVFGTASMYDPYRGISPSVTVLGMLIGEGFSFLRFIFLIAVLAWGIRLTVNWGQRFEYLKKEDWRYRKIRRMAGSSFQIINFIGIHVVPTLIIYSCMLPVITVFSYDTAFSIISMIFFLIALAAIFIEAYSDYHMNLFRKDVADGYAVGCCNYGLWRNSRHPNYLAEMIFWWAIYFAMLCSIPSKWYLFFGALLNTIMFVVVSIPLAESRLSEKAGWNRYRKSTHLLIPFPKSSRR